MQTIAVQCSHSAAMSHGKYMRRLAARQRNRDRVLRAGHKCIVIPYPDWFAQGARHAGKHIPSQAYDDPGGNNLCQSKEKALVFPYPSAFEAPGQTVVAVAQNEVGKEKAWVSLAEGYRDSNGTTEFCQVAIRWIILVIMVVRSNPVIDLTDIVEYR